MSELQKYIDSANAMQSAKPGTIYWMSCANVFRDMGYVQIAALMVEAGTRIEALEKVQALAIELCDAVDAAEFDVGGSRPLKAIIGELGPAVEAARKQA